MESPVDEIIPIVKCLASGTTPEEYQDILQRYFTWDAGFRHPLCYVPPAPNSRDSILGIYTHYRAISPNTVGEGRVVAYDPAKNVLVLELVQVFHLFFSPFKPAPSRLVTHLTLRRENGLHYIAFQEDFYHPDHLMNLLVPPLAPLIRLVLHLATLFCVIASWFERITGQFPLRGPGRLAAAFDTRIRRRGLANTSVQNVMALKGTLGGLRNSEARVTLGVRSGVAKTRESVKAKVRAEVNGK